MAFSPRPKASLGIPTRAEPVSDSRLEARSFFREAPCSYRDKPPNTTQHRLWLDISAIDITEMEKMDKDYNSNLWKNFRFVRSGKTLKGSGSKTNISVPVVLKTDHERAFRDDVAKNYPLKIPKPSRVGEHTYEKFIGLARFSDEKRKTIQLHTKKTQNLEKKELKIRSECRAPPLDCEGHLLPPANFKKYPKFVEWKDETEDRPLPYTTTGRNNYTIGRSKMHTAQSSWRHKTGKFSPEYYIST